MIVCKFGGSATTDLVAIKNIKKISKNQRRKIFVFSAIGKDECLPIKLTDLLIQYCESETEIEKKKNFNKIKEKINKLIYLTKVKINLNYYLNKIKNSHDKNYIISRGEFITTKIMSKYLNIKFIPAEKIICFFNNKIDFKNTQINLNYYLKKYDRICTCGFYGVDLVNKEIVLFERGGGDTTGALITKMTNSIIYENITDISGVKAADPKIIKNPDTISKIGYQEMAIISHYGGSVLHESVCLLLKESKVITKIINIFNLKSEKTIINKNYYFVKFVGYKKYKTNIKIIFNCENDLLSKIKNVKKNKKYYYIISDENNYQNDLRNIYNIIFKRI